MNGVVKQLPAGSQGCDVNQILNPAQSTALKLAGMSFVIRYIPRAPTLSEGNITTEEAEAILSAGLSIGLVQHCPAEGWSPSGALGENYGLYAASYATMKGFPKGMQIWLDLEGVASGTATTDTVAYCENWFKEVVAGGFLPGLYCGFGCGLSPNDLYSKLSVKAYWRSYNYYDGVSVRGYCMLQHPQKIIAGITVDPDTVQADSFGGLPVFLCPE